MADKTQHYLDQHLRAQLRKTGCPVCAESARSEDSYFAWYLMETYAFPGVLQEFKNALGFCREHGARLLRCSNCAPQISFFHGYATHHILKLMQQDPAQNAELLQLLTAPAQCPACKADADGNQRMVHFLQRLMIRTSDFKIYNDPGILCFPHLRILMRDLPSHLLERVLSIHRHAMESLGASLGESPSPESDRSCHKSIPAPLESVLRLAVGHRPALNLLPAPDAGVADQPPRDPIAEFVTNMHSASACAVCVEVNRAWREWTGWLENAVQTPQNLDDILPTCREHVWACVEHGSARFRVAAARNALEKALHHVRLGCDAFSDKAPRKVENPAVRAWRRWREIRTQPARARRVTLLPVSCPVCDRLATAQDRAIALLLALLEQRRHQAIFEAGYGLCLKHCSRALALAPRSELRTILIEVERAKLASLQWELEEFSRKTIWRARPESGGTEQSASKKAIGRFSGLPG